MSEYGSPPTRDRQRSLDCRGIAASGTSRPESGLKAAGCGRLVIHCGQGWGDQFVEDVIYFRGRLRHSFIQPPIQNQDESGGYVFGEKISRNAARGFPPSRMPFLTAPAITSARTLRKWSWRIALPLGPIRSPPACRCW